MLVSKQMTFSELVPAMWQNRVKVFIGAAIFFSLLFLGLFVFVDSFQIRVMEGLKNLAIAGLGSVGVIWLISVAWKQAMANFRAHKPAKE